MSKIAFESAVALATEKINEHANLIGIDLSITPIDTKILEGGWLFFWNSSRFIRNGSFSDRLAGNGPIYVTNAGLIHQISSDDPWEVAVLQIDAQR